VREVAGSNPVVRTISINYGCHFGSRNCVWQSARHFVINELNYSQRVRVGSASGHYE